MSQTITEKKSADTGNRRLRQFSSAFVVCLLLVGGMVQAPAQQPLEEPGQAQSKNMRLVGFNDLQGRSSYQPIIHLQHERWIAYVGTHWGTRFNSLTGVREGNGTLIVDVTDPRNPTTLFHIPGDREHPTDRAQAQMVRACEIGGQAFLLRSSGSSSHEIWNVTDPSRPQFVSMVVDGLTDTHKNWWECDTGIAYIVGGDPAWRSNRMTKVFDLSNPAQPLFIRDFGLVGQEPGSTVEPVPPPLHGPIAAANRIYFAYGTTSDGVLQIVDRERLLKGDPAPTPENLFFPQISRLEMAPSWGGHTSFPVLGVEITDFTDNLFGRVRDFVVLVSESVGRECREPRHLVFLVDITEEEEPFSVANFQVPESDGDFCQRGGRFGPHASNESFTPIYYRRIVFISYWNAGVRAVDIRNPFKPEEVAFFIPAVTEKTTPTCLTVDGQQRCKVAVQTNNVEVDDRGLIYIVDRAGTGLHILELTGSARNIAQFP